MKDTHQTQTLRTSGFTIIEIMVVILIIGMLFVWVTRQFKGGFEAARSVQAKTGLANINRAIVEYHTDIHEWPTRLQDLATKPTTIKPGVHWHTYIKEENELMDPWNNEYVYRRNPTGSKKPYELYSWGAEGEGSEESSHIYID